MTEPNEELLQAVHRFNDGPRNDARVWQLVHRVYDAGVKYGRAERDGMVTVPAVDASDRLSLVAPSVRGLDVMGALFKYADAVEARVLAECEDDGDLKAARTDESDALREVINAIRDYARDVRWIAPTTEDHR